MQIRLNVDDALLMQAADYAGTQERSVLVHEALKAFIQRESARRLAELGGTEPKLKGTTRRQSR